MSRSNFKTVIPRFLKKVKITSVENLRIFVLDLASAFIEGSPVDTGRFARAWHASFGTMEKWQPPEAIYGADGGRVAYAEIAAKVQTLTFEQLENFIYLHNNLPYAIPLEYGHSKIQAPHGIVRPVIAQVKAL